MTDHMGKAAPSHAMTDPDGQVAPSHAMTDLKGQVQVDPRTTAAELRKRLLKDMGSRASAVIPQAAPKKPDQITLDASAKNIVSTAKSIAPALMTLTPSKEVTGESIAPARGTPGKDVKAQFIVPALMPLTSSKEVKGTSIAPATRTPGKEVEGGGDAALARLVDEDDDLREWLIYTKYYDVNHRKNELARFRGLVEARRLRREEQRLATARRKLEETYNIDQDDYTLAVTTVQKRQLDAEPDRKQPAKVPKRHTVAKDVDTVDTSTDDKFMPLAAHKDAEHAGYWSPSPHGSLHPKPVYLGDNGETRFFLIKFPNKNHLTACMEDGIWVTQHRNTETLTSAYAQCKNVILFFSINDSLGFQGYARMTTVPSFDVPIPRWAKGIKWPVSPPFRVEWLATATVEFEHIDHLRNQLNEGLPVHLGRDGQEIEEQCGRQLLHEMECIIKGKNEQRLYRGRGGFSVRGRGGNWY